MNNGHSELVHFYNWHGYTDVQKDLSVDRGRVVPKNIHISFDLAVEVVWFTVSPVKPVDRRVPRFPHPGARLDRI